MLKKREIILDNAILFVYNWGESEETMRTVFAILVMYACEYLKYNTKIEWSERTEQFAALVWFLGLFLCVVADFSSLGGKP